MTTFIAAALIALNTTTLNKAETAETVLKTAQTQATKQDKNILLKFSASWCTWCHRMNDWIKQTEAGKLLAKNYIIVTLIVDEPEEKKSLENNGASDLRDKLGGKGQGIPFCAVLDKNLKPLVNSIAKTEKPSNIGFPVENFEIAHFVKMLDDTSKLTDAQLKIIEKSLQETAKKIKGGS